MYLRSISFLCLLSLSLLFGQSSVFANGAPDWARLKQDGDAALSANNYGSAERNLTQALTAAETFGNADIRTAHTLHSLATLYTTRGQFNKAETLYERELRVTEKALGAEHPDVVSAVGKLTQFYLSHSSAAKADRMANLLLAFADRKVKEQDSLKGNLAKLDQYYARSADYGEARGILHRLQEVTGKANANQGLELATTLDAVGALYKGLGRPDFAEKMYKRALSFREHTLASGHLALAYSYENLANLYSAQGKHEEAQQYFKQALAVTEKTLQPERPEVFRRLDELAQTQITLGQTAQAISLYQRALQILEKSSAGNPDVGKASCALGMLYIKDGRYGQAEPLMKRALQVAESANGPQHAALVPILENYAEVLDKVNKSAEAAKMRSRAGAIKGTAIVHKDTAGNNF